MIGIYLSLIAGVLLGLFQVLNGKASAISLGTGNILLLGISAVTVIGLTLVTGGFSDIRSLSLTATGWFALAGAIHFSGGWLFMSLSQRKVGVGITGLLIGATPAFTATLAWFGVQESISPKEILGIGLIILGVWIASWK